MDYICQKRLDPDALYYNARPAPYSLMLSQNQRPLFFRQLADSVVSQGLRLDEVRLPQREE